MILVTGATGTVGRVPVRRLSEPGAPFSCTSLRPASIMQTLVDLGRGMPIACAFERTAPPAMSVPLAWNDAGLPDGAQWVGRYRDQPTPLCRAALLETARTWADRRSSERLPT